MKPLLLLLTLISASISSAQTQPPVSLENGAIFDSNYEYILYPSPDAEYLNVLEVGPGKTYLEIHDIPLSLVVKNTLIKIYYRPEPYRTQVFVDVVGNANEKVRFQGIPNQNGTLPVISFINATTWGNTIDPTLQSGSAFVVFGTWSNKPAYIDIVNLHIMDGTYAGVWAKGDHISVKGCILENTTNGVFFQAADQFLIEISTHILIEGCKFMGNGTVNGWLHHNIYSQGLHTLIQFNTIESVQTGSLGASLKDRSAHTVVRYNYIETSSRTLDLVEPEDTDQILTQDPNWGDVYVYGNLIINKDVPVDQSGVSMIHYGYDNSPTYRREGTLYFTNNTVIIERADNPWRVNLFDVNSTNSTVEFSNNIVTATGMETFYIFRSNNTDNAGIVNFNASYFSISNTQNNWELTENAGSYSMTGQSNILEGSNPGFTDQTNEVYTLSNSSPCLANGIDIGANFNFNVDYNSITNLVAYNRTDQANPNLGCYSSDISTMSILDQVIGENLKHNVQPNPFNESATISFSLTESSFCTVKVYSCLGQEIKTLSNENYIAGEHFLQWDGTNAENNKVTKGAYFYSIETEYSRVSGKMIFR